MPIEETPFAIPTGASSLETVHSADYVWDSSLRGRHRQVILQQTIEGEGRFVIDGKEHKVGPGRMLIAIVPEESIYFFRPGVAPQWSFHWLNLRGDFGVWQWKRLRDRFGPVVSLPPHGAATRALRRLIRAVESRSLQGTQVTAEAMYSFYVTCWLFLMGHDEEAPAPAIALRDVIRNRFHEPVNIKELCAEIGQSREHLCRVFKASYGIEPAAYLRGFRMEAAETLLRRSALPVQEIAKRCGFASPRQFTKSFAASNGISPGEFRSGRQSRNG